MTVQEVIESLQELANEGYGDFKMVINIPNEDGGRTHCKEFSFCVYEKECEKDSFVQIEEMDERIGTRLFIDQELGQHEDYYEEI